VKKIVVVDDEKDLASMIKMNLEENGEYEVIVTNDPQEAEDLCVEHQPDLIIVDEVMPEIKGHQLIRNIRKNAKIKGIPIIAMSGLGEMVYYQKENKWNWVPNSKVVENRGDIITEKMSDIAAEKYGVEGFIAKPFGAAQLEEVITQTIDDYETIEIRREQASRKHYGQ